MLVPCGRLRFIVHWPCVSEHSHHDDSEREKRHRIQNPRDSAATIEYQLSTGLEVGYPVCNDEREKVGAKY